MSLAVRRPTRWISLAVRNPAALMSLAVRKPTRWISMDVRNPAGLDELGCEETY